MKASSVVLWIVLVLVVALLGIVAWTFAYYRPTVYVADVYVNPRYLKIAAAIGMVASLFVLGFIARMLLRT